ncbi:MAG: DUF5696 domain-containing protein, partial [Planctomycetia bacterium]|nr:DUF5696 domain-containing protein [Planctomycetia bacterium]
HVKSLGTRIDRATSGIPLRQVTNETEKMDPTTGNDGKNRTDGGAENGTENNGKNGTGDGAKNRIVYRHTFESVTDGTFDVVVSIEPALSTSDDGEDPEPTEAFRVDVRLENAPPPKPWRLVRLEDVALGEWSDTVKYLYAGVGNVVKGPGSFRLGFDGHQLASSYVGLDFAAERLPGSVADGKTPASAPVSVVLGTLNTPDAFQSAPDQKHYSIHTASTTCVTFFLIPCEQVFRGVAIWRDVCGKGKSPDADQLAGKFVFDLWGGRYADVTKKLTQAFQYGLTDTVVVFHNWQRWGYDYRLPEIYPPNPNLGTLEEMRALRDLCAEHDVIFAPHDNYVDIYPDADTFSYETTVAFHPNGTPYPAWFNEGRGARSYRYRADAIPRIVRPNIEKIQTGLAPTAYFIDVWSSLGAYDFFTSDGTFYDRTYTNKVWGDTFNHIRETFRGNNGRSGPAGGAPQISESGHDGLVGILDGAQTNHLRAEHPEKAVGWAIWNIPHEDAERTPWLDAAYHDRFILHGAGYPGRYEGGLPATEHGIYTDDYICTEVLDGHPGMVSHPFNREVVRKYWLTAPVARSLAGATIESVRYAGGDLHRQIVVWKTVSGDRVSVYVNRGTTDWTLPAATETEREPDAPGAIFHAPVTLPGYGFLVCDGKLSSAGIIREKETGLIREFALSGQRGGGSQLYVNGRYPVGYQPISCTLESMEFAPENSRMFRGTFRWRTSQPIPAPYRLFLHVTDPEKAAEGIVHQIWGQQPIDVQKNTDVREFTTTFQGELPADVAEMIASGKTIELRGGLFLPETGQRLDIVGTQDSNRRWRWFTFTRADESGTLTYTPIESTPDTRLDRFNPEKIPFRTVVGSTAYGCLIRSRNDFPFSADVRESSPEVVEIVPLPAPEGAIGVTFEAEVPWSPDWKLTAYDSEGREIATESRLSADGNTMSLIGTPEVFRFVVTPTL